ncbi:DUF1592 domain-containing protein [Tamlana sp. 2201CG12-4]|uniref:DUF1592 domain-containing protein n=1 Tax=Tamlana sp. 2201CG12-4 TaxID=3112582 RepID=UPI002DBBE04B|nr:DUF1592 domain-containing protein [Tamlana sp. 2201CG12-4]MEC3907887.1 DUF1592 domain-containing protein [Tamlana sp. 2201CG12-4]
MKLTLAVASVITLILFGLILIPINIDEGNEVVLYFGNFHPLLLHIPIGALLGVLVMEVVNLIKPKLKLENSGKVLLWFTVLSIIPTVLFGFFLASSGGYKEEVLSFHKWLGWATALLSVWLLVYRTWAYTTSKRYVRIYQLLLLINVGLLTFAGHYGGSLTHGSNYLTKDMPDSLKELFGVEKTKAESILSSIKELAEDKDSNQDVNRAFTFADTIHPILDNNCFKCHNENKQKGDLRLDTVGWEMLNAEDVLTWKTVYKEISEGNMPPEEEEPLTEVERNNLLSWITQSLEDVSPEMKQEVALEEKIKEEAKAKKEQEELSLFLSQEQNNLSKEGLEYTNAVKPVFAKYCYSCHGADKQKGGVRLDRLNWDMVNGPDAESWHSALDMINSGEMPPKKKPQLKPDELQLVVDWMTSSLAKAAISKQNASKGVMRRLTKEQYTNTLKELLDIPLNFGAVLPDDGKSKMGFSNNGEVLQISPLHIDYYQKIAREALDEAIVFGDKPETIKYKVDISRGITKDKHGAEFRGFQTIAISSNNFSIDVYKKDASPDLLNKIKGSIGLGMRGSANDRFSVVKEGMLLNSALPHQELPPRSWQGPSPNLKMIIKDYFPRKGDFVLRVEASKGYVYKGGERLIGLREKVPAPKSSEAILIKPEDFKDLKNLKIIDNKWLVSTNVTDDVNASFKYNVPKEGYYQIDLVHPYVADDAMPSIRLGLLKKGVIQERFHMEKEQEGLDSIVTPLRLIYLNKGIHTGTLDRKFFVGLSSIIMTPVSEDSPYLNELEEEVTRNEAKYQFDKPSVRVFAGSRTDDGMDYKNFDHTKQVTASFGDSQILEFKGRLENLPVPAAGSNVSGDLANMMVLGLWNDFLVKNVEDTGPPLLVKSIEFEAPYYPTWPPKSHHNILFDSPNKSNKDLYTEEVITRFMERAFRRPVTESEVNRYMNFWQSIKEDYTRYEDGVKEVLIAILCSPSFLYIFEPENPEIKVKEQEFYLASNLSYFLWNSPPDTELMNLASDHKLRNELQGQIKRMVDDSKIWRMIRSFTYEWLRIDRHKSMNTNMKMYKDYSRFVKEDMSEETYQFMHHVLKENMSIMNLIDSDFAMLNQNLAEFYGINGISGNEFRPVELDKSFNRGGLLSQGAFLNGHSDGEQAHPIKRAVWLKEKILGDPAPPPPPNVPEIDPDTPGFEKLTLKEQLELHRNKASCISCHLKIDPYGVVFENYDAVGRFKRMAKGKPIDVTSVLPDGTEVEGIKGIKEYILYQKTEEFTKSLVEHLFTYALGRTITFADEAEISDIVKKVKTKNFKFQSVIEEIVLSPSFSKG